DVCSSDLYPVPSDISKFRGIAFALFIPVFVTATVPVSKISVPDESCILMLIVPVEEEKIFTDVRVTVSSTSKTTPQLFVTKVEEPAGGSSIPTLLSPAPSATDSTQNEVVSVSSSVSKVVPVNIGSVASAASYQLTIPSDATSSSIAFGPHNIKSDSLFTSSKSG